MATNATLSVVPEAQLGTKGLVVTVKKDGDIFGHLMIGKASLFGHLMIGKASLVWFEKHAKSKGRKLFWDDFHKWIMQKAETSATRPSMT